MAAPVIDYEVMFWYRNEDLPASTVIKEIPYEMRSMQYEVGLRVSVAF